jgi:hypothetical protein
VFTFTICAVLLALQEEASPAGLPLHLRALR